MEWNPRNQLFFALITLLFLTNILLLNDVATLWYGAETFMANLALTGEYHLNPAIWLQGQFLQGEFREVILRLPGVFVLVGSLGFTYILARPLFGQKRTLLFLLVLMSSLTLSTLAKIGSLDVWQFGLQLLLTLSMLRFLKQPNEQTFLPYLLIGILGAFVLGVYHMIYWVLLLFFFIFNKIGAFPLKHKWSVIHLAGVVVLGIVVFALKQTSGETQQLQSDLFVVKDWKHLIFALVGLMPFLGFVVAGLIDTFRKSRKKEELSLIIASWILASAFSLSVGLLAPLALLVARHLQDYFRSNYPYKGWVQGMSVFHLVGVFFLAALLMLGGMFTFSGTGFRSGMAWGGLYWMLNILVMIGLVGNFRRYVWGGSMLAGTLAVTLFWLQLFPLWESERLPAALTELLDAKDIDQIHYQPLHTETLQEDNVLFYLRQNNIQVETKADSPEASWRLQELHTADEVQADTILSGRNDRGGAVWYAVGQ